ncbi:hypothetical protein [Sphaerimonospora thailandensis]|uniref:Uncharacterized protein n=1 Tax=Sphaerimonospora thailandensis TaxID=795644 RepID=A0A8J3RB55_9ACTN|nr:hypothetical protein [Sphaerimonospora thailandensis]GIH71076.1 hypothetical protein Mth01_33290 [Sphaerimonospora thailandensis]
MLPSRLPRTDLLIGFAIMALGTLEAFTVATAPPISQGATMSEVTK